jgi:ribosomal-protein-alanine N-acetyltransferase
MVETHRLRILPLNHDELELYLRADGEFEKSFGLKDTNRKVAADVKEMVEKFTIPKMKLADAENYLFYTFWLVIEKSSRTIVAELGFKGEPGPAGDIEIGYGTMPRSRGKGFMTEAVGGMIQWARSYPGIRIMLAETEQSNLASVRVVTKNQFQLLRQEDNRIWWKIELK